MPESQLHLELRTLLYQLLSDHLGLDTTVGSVQFVYFDAADPRQSVAPDVYVRLQPRAEPIRSWKTWERGAPDVAVEIVSDSDAAESVWSLKLRAYTSLGARAGTTQLCQPHRWQLLGGPFKRSHGTPTFGILAMD